MPQNIENAKKKKKGGTHTSSWAGLQGFGTFAMGVRALMIIPVIFNDFCSSAFLPTARTSSCAFTIRCFSCREKSTNNTKARFARNFSTYTPELMTDCDWKEGEFEVHPLFTYANLNFMYWCSQIWQETPWWRNPRPEQITSSEESTENRHSTNRVPA